MTVSLSLPIKGFSVNATYYASRKFKTAEFRRWESQTSTLIAEYPELKVLGDAFNAHGGTFSVTYIFYYPEAVYHNKFGAVSAKTFDLTNTEKTIQDLVFAEMGVDDRFVTKLRSYKEVGVSHRVDIILKFNRKPDTGNPVGTAASA